MFSSQKIEKHLSMHVSACLEVSMCVCVYIYTHTSLITCRGVQGSQETATTDQSRETAPHLKQTAGAEAGKRRLVVFPTPVQ